MSGPKSGPLVIASKIPHVACRVPEMPNDVIFALLEQDTSVAEPLDAMRHNRFGGFPYPGTSKDDVKFLPLDFRPGETNKKLTFIVQKARKAEFFIDVPKRARNQREE